MMRGRGATYRNSKRIAINALEEQMCEEEAVGFVYLWGYFVGGKGTAMFSENLLRSMDSGIGCNFLN